MLHPTLFVVAREYIDLGENVTPMRIVLLNLAVFLAVCAFYGWIVPELMPDYRSYLPVMAGALLSWAGSYLVIYRRRGNALISVAGGALCALLVTVFSIAALVSMMGS